MAITAVESSFEELAEGMYAAHLAGWEEIPDNGYGPGLKLIWTLDDEKKGDGSAVDKWQFTSQKLTPMSKLWGFLKTMGVEPVLGRTYELDELLDGIVGRAANLGIKHVDGPKGPQARVADVYPIKGAAPAKRAAAPGVHVVKDDEAEPDPCFICGAGGVAYDAQGRGVCTKHADVA